MNGRASRRLLIAPLIPGINDDPAQVADPRGGHGRGCVEYRGHPAPPARRGA